MEGGGWLWLIIDVVAVAVLAAGLIYGMTMWRRHRKSRAERHMQEEVVRENYRRGG
jgi:flagellar basal body-associated protein FliL